MAVDNVLMDRANEEGVGEGQVARQKWRTGGSGDEEEPGGDGGLGVGQKRGGRQWEERRQKGKE